MRGCRKCRETGYFICCGLNECGGVDKIDSDIMKTIKIIVATHKKYRMPSDTIYLPVHVGAECAADSDLGYLKDNVGENISGKNAGYCELTGLYWAWKNLHADYIGMVHYRRHFGRKIRGRNVFDRILTGNEITLLLGKYTVFVPKKRHYYIESLYSHYVHTLYAEPLDISRQIIAEKYPDYVKTCDKVMQQTWGYMFNMFIMNRDLLNQYCEWLFDILFELENRMESSALSEFHARFYGRVSEILFNVWLTQQIVQGKIMQEEVMELDYIYMEKVDWIKKGRAFLGAKFLGRKYEGSF